MKTTLKIAGLAILLSLGLGACEKEYVTPGGVDETEKMLSEPVRLENTDWHIVSFQWHNRIPNDHFTEYKFHFGTYGNIFARSRNDINVGRWGLYNRAEVHLNFRDQDPLKELNNKWKVSEFSRYHMVLKGNDPVDGSSEFIVMKRIIY
jgi:hypothetical protein